jgi:hypothetical protein
MVLGVEMPSAGFEPRLGQFFLQFFGAFAGRHFEVH